MTNTLNVLPGDHSALTESQKRTHYQQGCRHIECTRAASEYRKSRKKAAEPKPEGYVDHFATALAPAPDALTAATKPAREEPPATAPADPKPATPPLPQPPRPASGITSRGASRRLQGLIHMGYTRKELAEAVQVEVDSIWKLIIAPPATIPVALHRRIVDQFKTLRLSPKTTKDGTPEHVAAQWSRSLAAQMVWAGPYDWDDIDTDEKPSHAAHSKDAAAEHKSAAAFFLAETGLELDAEPAAAAAGDLQDIINGQTQQIDELTERLAVADSQITRLLTAESENAASLQQQLEASRRRAGELATELADTRAQLDLVRAVAESAEYEEKTEVAEPAEARVLQDYVDRIVLTVDGPVLTLELPIPGRR